MLKSIEFDLVVDSELVFLGSSGSLVGNSSFCTVLQEFWVIDVSWLSSETPRMLLLSLGLLG